MGELTSSDLERIAQKMIRHGNSFEGALGAAIIHGEYRDKRKIINAFPQLWERLAEHKI